ncbi:MAG: P-loop NTPase [Treponema sp.]
MNQECNHQCGVCAASCGQRSEAQTEYAKNPNAKSCIKNVIAVVSGKGGVGKSLVTSLLASAVNRKGLHTAILDADITGPSIPKAFGVCSKAAATETGILPVKTDCGISLMSINLLLDNETDPVIWRGPIIAGTVTQFWTDVLWGDIDYLFIDMPPGTGDVPLTVFQSIPVTGIIVVTSPQELVSMIVAKAVNMAKKMNIPILGLVENFSYFTCPDNGKNYAIFGESHIEQIAAEYKLPVLAKLPIDPAVAAACDRGTIGRTQTPYLNNAVDTLFTHCRSS